MSVEKGDKIINEFTKYLIKENDRKDMLIATLQGKIEDLTEAVGYYRGLNTQTEEITRDEWEKLVEECNE